MKYICNYTQFKDVLDYQAKCRPHNRGLVLETGIGSTIQELYACPEGLPCTEPFEVKEIKVYVDICNKLNIWYRGEGKDHASSNYIKICEKKKTVCKYDIGDVVWCGKESGKAVPCIVILIEVKDNGIYYQLAKYEKYWAVCLFKVKEEDLKDKEEDVKSPTPITKIFNQHWFY